MIPARAMVCRTVLSYRGLVERIAPDYGLDPWLVLAVIAQESLGNPYAVRVERGFFRRYYDGLLALVRRTLSRDDDRWFQYPDLFSASYGLMQVMYPVALEGGATRRYPTEGCDPTRSIHDGCRKLRKDFSDVGGIVANRVSTDPTIIRRALLRYNGGGYPEYPDKVFAWWRDLQVLGAPPQPAGTTPAQENA